MKLTTKQQKRITQTLRTTTLAGLTKRILRQFPDAEVYFVGGFVRDLLLGRDTKDIDIVIRGVPARDLQKMLTQNGKVNLVGKNFGVFKFVPKGKIMPAIDIALPRREHAFGTGGYRDVAVQSNWRLSITDDLSRRDFTINAMAWNVRTRKLIDPFSGLMDLKKKTIRAVGNPAERFQEDYSRMLRALRFSCQLGFNIEPKTRRALVAQMPRLNKKQKGERIVPHEVIAKELLKAFFANPVLALEIFDHTGVIKTLAPELLKMKGCKQPKNHHSEGDVWKHTCLCLKELASKNFEKEFNERANAEVVIATLFHDIAKPLTIKQENGRLRYLEHNTKGATLTKKIAERLKFSSCKDMGINVDADRLYALVYYHLLLLSSDPHAMRATTIERHYIRDPLLGKEMLMVQYADGAGTRNEKNQKGLGPYRIIKKRIKTLMGAKKKTLPAPLLNGNEIMRVLGIKPGPEIGKIITELREAQLQKKITTKLAAKRFIKNIKI